MWFDPAKALAEIEAGDIPASAPGAVQAAEARARVAHVAQVAPPPAPVSEAAPAPCRTSRTCRTPPTADAAIPLAPEADARAYLAHLMQHGPATVGAAGSALGWGATRAWQAEARLRAAGLVMMGPLGRAVPVNGGKA